MVSCRSDYFPIFTLCSALVLSLVGVKCFGVGNMFVCVPHICKCVCDIGVGLDGMC